MRVARLHTLFVFMLSFVCERLVHEGDTVRHRNRRKERERVCVCGVPVQVQVAV